VASIWTPDGVKLQMVGARPSATRLTFGGVNHGLARRRSYIQANQHPIAHRGPLPLSLPIDEGIRCIWWWLFGFPSRPRFG